jgi:nucleoside-diphosphate-sugar epimerase
METIVLRPPWIASPEELAAVHAMGGQVPQRFDTFAYVDLRDVAEAYRLAIEAPLSGHHVLFVAAPDSIIARPLAEILPELAPALGDKAAELTGTRSFVTSDRARATLGWVPRFGWREVAALAGSDGTGGQTGMTGP